MTLVIIVLITVVTVGYLASVMLETKTAGSSLDQERAYGIAMVGVHQAMARSAMLSAPGMIRTRILPLATLPFYWSLSPGRITRWSYSERKPATNIALFSESARGQLWSTSTVSSVMDPIRSSAGRMRQKSRSNGRTCCAIQHSPPAPTTRSSVAMHSGSMTKAPRSTSTPRTERRNTPPIRSASVRLPK